MGSYQRGRVSLPSDTGGPSIEQVVGPRGTLFLEEEEGKRMRRPEVDVRRELGLDATRVYNVPVLMRSKARYAHFVKDLRRRGLVRYSIGCKERVGIFFVLKKSGLLRLIIDARRTNKWFHRPPAVSLLTSEGLASIEVEMDTLASTAVPITVGVGDVADAFHRLAAPIWLQAFFGMNEIEAHWVGVTEIGGSPIAGETLLTPLPH